jgi:hypothetical protein
MKALKEDICGRTDQGGDRSRGLTTKVAKPSRRKEMAHHPVSANDTSIRLAYLTFGIRETCCKYQPK